MNHLIFFPPLKSAFLITSVLFLLVGCKDQGSPMEPTGQVFTVALRNTDTFQYPTVGGDEEGARITRQATHYSVSEIRRNAATNFVAVYVYQPKAGYAGIDYAEIKILTGSDGASPPTKVTAVAFRFIVTD